MNFGLNGSDAQCSAINMKCSSLEEGLEQLIKAARCGDLEGVKQYITAENINSEGSLNMTALGEACRAAHKDVVKFLLEAGANVGDVLHLVCEYKAVDLVDLMLASGVPTDTFDKYGRTPLIVAVERQNILAVEALLKNGASVNQVDRKDGESPLYKACETECLPIVRVLLESGASVNLRRFISSYTPLHIACLTNRSTLVIETLLKHGASVDEVDDVDDEYPLGNTPLHLACERGRPDIVRLLVEHNASVDASNRHRKSPLRMASNDSVTSILLDYGAGRGKCMRRLRFCPCTGLELWCVYQDHLRNNSVGAFERHFIKVRTAGISHLMSHWLDNDPSPNLVHHFFGFGFPSKCSAEIEQLKTRKLGDNNTYHDLMLRKKSALHDKAIIENWSPESLNEFPIYRDIIYSSYLKIPEWVRRRGLISKCSCFFMFTTFARLPPELVPLILHHLPNEDLERLVEIIEFQAKQSQSHGAPRAGKEGI